jgi:hypothetical protein
LFLVIGGGRLKAIVIDLAKTGQVVEGSIVVMRRIRLIACVEEILFSVLMFVKIHHFVNPNLSAHILRQRRADNAEDAETQNRQMSRIHNYHLFHCFFTTG